MKFMIKKINLISNYFSNKELLLYLSSMTIIVISFMLFDRSNYLIFSASLIGVTSLILTAKGNAIGQFLMIIFSILYGIISYTYSYYGEMITYLGMTAPMALFSLISWLKNPYKDNKMQVKVNKLSSKEYMVLTLNTIFITIIFYFILNAFNTANILLSTISVTTTFIAVYLTFKRSPYYAIAYATNDIILIILWIMASFTNKSYISVVICFVIFLVNDVYGFINWCKMKTEQNNKYIS